MANSLLPITACFIARDEELDLPNAIASVGFVKEIVVVVDSRTQDRTAEVAKESAAPGQEIRLLKREWEGHVGQKNAALAAATHDWVLCLDADERVCEALSAEILRLFEDSLPAMDGYSMPRRTFYLGRWINHGGWYPDRKIRLFRKSRGHWGGEDPHDRVVTDGRVGGLHGDLLHHTYRNIAEHIDKLDAYTQVAAEKMWKRGVRHPVFKMFLHPPAKFVKAYLLKRGFLDGFPGLIIACLGTYAVFLKYAKLWERGDWERKARSHGAVRDL
jgi:glycosyltransferase involved in cell wall biosynthesis